MEEKLGREWWWPICQLSGGSTLWSHVLDRQFHSGECLQIEGMSARKGTKIRRNNEICGLIRIWQQVCASCHMLYFCSGHGLHVIGHGNDRKQNNNEHRQREQLQFPVDLSGLCGSIAQAAYPNDCNGRRKCEPCDIEKNFHVINEIVLDRRKYLCERKIKKRHELTRSRHSF